MSNRVINTINKATAPIRGYWFKVGTDPEKVLEAWQPEPSDRLPTTWGDMAPDRLVEALRRLERAEAISYGSMAISSCLMVLLAFAVLFIAELWPYAVKGGFR